MYWYNKIKSLKLLMLFFILIACEKENKDNPAVYIFDSFETGEIRVYTKDGEIKNEQLSASFAERWSEYFYKKDSFEFTDFDYNGKITIHANHQTSIEGSDTSVICKAYLRSGVVYFESDDTLYSTRDLINMKDPRFRFYPITQTEIKQVGFGGYPPMPIVYYGYLPCIYALDEGQVLKFPFTGFLEKLFNSYSGDYFMVNALSNINNMFDKNYLRRFTNLVPLDSTSQDTIVIQENFLVFRKQ